MSNRPELDVTWGKDKFRGPGRYVLPAMIIRAAAHPLVLASMMFFLGDEAGRKLMQAAELLAR